MSRIRTVLLVLGALAVIVAPGYPNRARHGASRTGEFAIDGTIFRVEEPSCDDSSAVVRELASRGIDALSIPDQLSSAIAPDSAEPLHARPDKVMAPRLPRGLEPDHVLRLESATGPVEIAFGRMACEANDIVFRLRSAGWELTETRTSGASWFVARLVEGKETTLALLDKDEGRFLAIRRSLR